jgi:hypothetical protein
MSDHLWQICNVACIMGVDIVVVICSFCMYMDVHYSSMLRSLVDSHVEWYLKGQKMLLFVYYLYVFLFVCSFLTYVECAGWMSGEVSCVE